MANNPLLPQDIAMFNQASAQNHATSPQYPQGYVFATPPTTMGPPAFRLFDAAYITTGIIDPNRLGSGATGAGNLYLADDGTWKTVSSGGGGNMSTSTYDTDNSGVVDNAESISIIGRNSTGSTLYKGTIVYISGSTGNRPNFVKAQANVEATSAGTFGVVRADILNNSDGYVTTIGYLDNLDTRSTATNPFTDVTLADGDTVYLHPTIAGYITNVKPSAPNHLVYVGKVTRTSPTNGTIIYRIQNGYELEELHNVAISGVANNDLLTYESSTSLWKNKTIASIFGGTPLIAVPTLDQVTAAGNTTTNAITVGNVGIGIAPTTTLQVLRGTAGLMAKNQYETAAFEYNGDNKIGIYSSASTIGSVGVSMLLGMSNYTISSLYPGFEFQYVPNATLANNVVKYNFVGRNVSGVVTSYAIDLFNIYQDGRVVINGSGSGYSPNSKLLIGTSTDAGYKLDVNGTGIFRGNLEVNAGGNGGIFVNNVYPRLIFGKTGTPSWSMYADTENSGQFEMGKGAGYPYNTFSRFLWVSSNEKIAIGGASLPSAKILLSGSVTASSALGVGTSITQTITAAANNDVLVGLDINPTFTSGAFTGLGKIAARIQSGALLVGTALLNTDVISFPVQVNGSSQNIGAVWRNALSTGYTSFRFYNDQNLNTRAMEMGYAGSAYPSAIVTGGVTGESAYLTTTGAYPLQLGTNNTARFIVFSNGNVGVSTNTDAGYKLDVNGTVRFGDLASTYYVTLANGGADGAIFRVGGASYGYAEIKSTAITLNGGHSISGTGGTAQFTLTSQVAPPAAQSNAAIKFVADNPGSGGGTWAAYTTALAFNFLKKETGGTYTSILAMNANSNNVGIGTTTPAEKLEVIGNIKATSFIKSGGTSSQFLKADGSVDSTVYLSSAPTLQAVTDQGNTTTQQVNISGLLSAKGSVNLNNDSSTTGFNKAYYIFNDGYNTYGLTLAYNTGNYLTTLYASTSRRVSLAIANTNNPTAQSHLDHVLTVTQNSNVLIGTQTDASYKLDVNGTGRFTTSLRVYNGASADFYTDTTSSYTRFYINGQQSLDGTSGLSNANFYSQSGDTTLYINRPSGAGIQFREANGTAQLYIASGGNIGVGTISPYSILQVGAKVADDASFSYDSNALQVIHQTPTSTTVLNDPKQVLVLSRQGTGYQAFGASAVFELSRYENSGTDARTRLDLRLAHTNFLNGSNRIMTFLSSGSIGVGTTTPRAGTALDVVFSKTGGGTGIGITNTNASGFAELLFNNDNARTDGVGFIGLGGSTSAAANLMYLGTREAMPVLFYTSLTERMRITSGGDIGIGTDTPNGKVEIRGNRSATKDLLLNISKYDYGVTKIYQNYSNTYYTGGKSLEVELDSLPMLQLVINNVGTQGLFVVPNGNMLLGTTTDTGYKLEVNGFTKTNGMYLPTASDNSTGYISGSYSGGALNFYPVDRFGNTWFNHTGVGSIYFDSQGEHIFRTNYLDALDIKNNGNVLVGTTSDAGYKFDINGTLRAQNNIYGTAKIVAGLDYAGNVPSPLLRLTAMTPASAVYPVLGTASGAFMVAGDQTLYGMLMGVNTSTGAAWIQSMRTDSATAYNLFIQPVGGNVILGGTSDAGQKLQVNGSTFIRGTDSLSTTKVFEVQNGAGASIMDFRNAGVAFFGCGQGGGSNSGFVFRYDNTSYTQFSGYNYGAGSGSYKPILMDTDTVGRNQGIFINFGVSTNTPPNSDTEFAVLGRTSDTTSYIARFRNSGNTDKFAVRADGALFTNTLQGISGSYIITTSLGAKTFTITNGIITSVV